MKKRIVMVSAIIMAIVAFAGCGRTANDKITVVSREDGSGTRGAFIELFKIEEKDTNGNKVDYTTEDADITNSTSVMMTSAAVSPTMRPIDNIIPASIPGMADGITTLNTVRSLPAPKP